MSLFPVDPTPGPQASPNSSFDPNLDPKTKIDLTSHSNLNPRSNSELEVERVPTPELEVESSDEPLPTSEELASVPPRFRPEYTLDKIFKLVFGSGPSEPVLILFLKALLKKLGDAGIERLEFQTPVHRGQGFDVKDAEYDVVVTDETKRWFVVEMQRAVDKGLVKRFTLYGAHVLSEQSSRGDKYESVRPVVVVVILGETLFEEHHNVYTRIQLTDTINGGIVVNGLLDCHYFELSKLETGTKIGLDETAVAWLHLLKYGHEYGRGGKPLPEHLAAVEGISMAIDLYQQAINDRYARFVAFKQWVRRCEEREKAEEVQRKEAEARRIEAEARELREAMDALEAKLCEREEALKRKEEEALTKARADALEMARRMLARGIDPSIVEQCTGVSLADLGDSPGQAQSPTGG